MKYIINISDFNEIVKGIKAMKADLVLISGNWLYGTDNNCITLKSYQMNTTVPIEPFTIITKTLSTKFYNNITDVNVIIDTDVNKIYCPNNTSIIDDDEYPQMIDNRFNFRINQIVSNINNSIYNTMNNIINIGDITTDEYFDRFRTIKAGEGADLYNPKGDSRYGMYLYSGALPLTKSDTLELHIFDFGTTFISKFTVQKKKLNPVNIYFKFVKLENSVYRA